eukprot:COSAG02_NODE_13315_length_1411_cov_1.223323_1_plen_281_part_00
MWSGSGYGIVTILLRACQTAMLVFWIALMACAEKGYAIYAVVASLVVFLVAGWEATHRRALGRALVVNMLPLLIAGAIASTFWTVEHYDNNYANRSAPVGLPGSPQYFDCRERTSGIYPAAFFSAVSLVLMPLSLGMDPEHGVGCLRGESAQQKWKAQYHKDVLVVLSEVLIDEGIVGEGVSVGSVAGSDGPAEAVYECLGAAGLERGGALTSCSCSGFCCSTTLLGCSGCGCSACVSVSGSSSGSGCGMPSDFCSARSVCASALSSGCGSSSAAAEAGS